jgi:hypothetical protein
MRLLIGALLFLHAQESPIQQSCLRFSESLTNMVQRLFRFSANCSGCAPYRAQDGLYREKKYLGTYRITIDDPLKTPRHRSRGILYVGFILITLIWLSPLQPVEGAAPEPPWTDFAISSVSTTPSSLGEGDLVIFHAKVRIAQTNTVPLEWVGVDCFLDGELWYQGTLIVSGTEAVEAYSQSPWNATPGQHILSWIVDSENEYNDPDFSSNTMQYSFVVGDRQGDFDFSISVTPNLQTAKSDGPISYQVSLYSSREGAEMINLSLRNPPSEFVYSFSPRSVNSGHSSKLSLLPGSISSGVYYLTVNASGHMRSHSLTLALFVEPAPKQGSSISISLNPAPVTLGENVTIRGVVSPPQRGTVILRYTRPEGLTFIISLRSGSNGAFTYSFKPDESGTWAFTATLIGDTDYLGSSSGPASMKVNEPSDSPATNLLKQLETTPVVVLSAIAILLLEYSIMARATKRRRTTTRWNLSNSASEQSPYLIRLAE